MKKVIIFLVLMLVGAFLYWTVSPLFIETEVDDAIPEALLAPPANEPIEATGSPALADVKIVSEVPEDMPDDMKAVPVGNDFAIVTKTSAELAEAMPDMTDEPDVPMARNDVFPIVDTRGHPASGDIRVVSDGTQSIVRYENYDGTNGPDLFVYLAKDLDAEEFVDLGRARGNRGNINYEVPADIDVNEYKYVMTWCRAFGVLFDYAEIN